MSNFSDDIQAFNEMYGLPAPKVPTFKAVGNVPVRLKAFKAILLEEIGEIEGIFDAITLKTTSPEACLTMIADLLGDLQIYCASEMIKFGLPNAAVLGIIMQSNFSKLDASGKAIMDERGKVLKGPNYWKPEPKLQAMIEELISPAPTVTHSVADFATWKRDNLEAFAASTSAELTQCQADLKIALRSYRHAVAFPTLEGAEYQN